MINALLNGIFSLVISLVGTLLSPIDMVIEKFLPDVANALAMVNGFFDYIMDYVDWAVSWTFLNKEVLSIVVGYYTFKLTVPYLVSTVKLAIKWYDKIKP